MDKRELNKKIEQFEALRQTLYAVLMQKQKIKQQFDEIENAIGELEKISEGSEVFKMVGNIMIRKSKEAVLGELKDKKEFLEIRLKSLDKQEQTLKEKLEKLQKELENIIDSVG